LALDAADGQPTSDEPSADADESETTVEKAQPESKTKQSKPSKRNLDDDEDFRKYKSARDKQLADIKAEYERKLREREDERNRLELAQQQAALAGLQQGLANAVDDQERAQYIEQIAAIKSQAYVSQERAWAKYVAQEERAAGIEPGHRRCGEGHLAQATCRSKEGQRAGRHSRADQEGSGESTAGKRFGHHG
jgi:hypothetical protein